MTNQKTIVVIGGGYAGINLIDSLKKEFHREISDKIKLILVDKNHFHFKKVKLFKAIVNESVSDLHVPLNHYCGLDIEFIQGELKGIDPNEQTIHIKGVNGEFIQKSYDELVLAMGSVMREVDLTRGGITLNSLENAKAIRDQLLLELNSTKSSLRLAIVGSGITGIETAAELSTWMKNEMAKKGNKPKTIEIFLINDKKRLINEAPIKISERLESRLKKHGIQFIHNKKAEKFDENKVFFSDYSQLEVDLCIWTVGLKANPCLREFDLPLTEEGKLLVDSAYRLVGTTNIFAIGDCIHVVDPLTSEAAGMSCKEAISQAQRLAKIMKANAIGNTANGHQNYPNLLCIGLGPTDGFVWAQKWGVDFVLSGKVAERIREYTWNLASISQ